MASSITNDVRLDSPDDWDEWETALLNQAETYHILLVLQGIEDPIPKPEVRRIKDFMLKDIPLPSQPPVAPPTGPTPSASTARIGAAAGTRGHTASQPSQDSETVQSTESQEDVPSTMDTMDKERRKQIEKDALYAFSVHNNEYRVLYQLWETQCRDVDKVFNWMKKTVHLSYLKMCVSNTPDWRKAYRNLKSHLSQPQSDVYRKISSDYAAVFILLKQARTTKDLEAWIVKWDDVLTHAERKKMSIATNTIEWADKFFDAIDFLDHSWITTFKVHFHEKIDDGTLERRDLTNMFRRLIQQPHIRLRGRPSRGSFATQAGGNDNRSDHEAPRQPRRQNRSLDRSRGRSQSHSRERPSKKARLIKPEDMRTTTAPICPACGGRHFLLACFYILQHLGLLVPDNFEPWIYRQERAKEWTEKNTNMIDELVKHHEQLTLSANKEHPRSRSRSQGRAKEILGITQDKTTFQGELIPSE
ncbi:hypothetical protein EYB26_001152 [Talaromyces marneffei]|uniref:uncharacterized protein n=1 Tax=Talaromyces marneffei TaxID=37727 RepID=UPI0012A8C0A3|nr:uncharacterized protein EYB26_001152 [Talaromyces marneffei]QGA13502.1 hypothetical protein EYB26_001152 [Talaromyces marneffei]